MVTLLITCLIQGGEGNVWLPAAQGQVQSNPINCVQRIWVIMAQPNDDPDSPTQSSGAPAAGWRAQTWNLMKYLLSGCLSERQEQLISTWSLSGLEASRLLKVCGYLSGIVTSEITLKWIQDALIHELSVLQLPPFGRKLEGSEVNRKLTFLEYYCSWKLRRHSWKKICYGCGNPK